MEQWNRQQANHPTAAIGMSAVASRMRIDRDSRSSELHALPPQCPDGWIPVIQQVVICVILPHYYQRGVKSTNCVPNAAQRHS